MPGTDLRIWRIDLDDPRHAGAQRLAWLDPREQARRQHLRRPLDARRYAAAHTALRLLLSRCCGVGPAELRYEFDASGRPSLSDGPVFSLSHSADTALVAIGNQDALGIDLEVRRPAAELRWLAGFLGPAEQRATAAADIDLLRMWVRKEAVAKALGCGLTLPPGDIAVAPRNGRTRALALSRAGYSLWHLHDLDVGENRVAALAMRRTAAPAELRVRTMQL